MKRCVLAPADAATGAFAEQAQISVVELAEAHIRQIERLNPQLNAFADFDADRVRAQARKLDAAQARARRRCMACR